MKAVPGIWDSFFWHSFCRRKETFDQIERNGIVKVIERRFYYALGLYFSVIVSWSFGRGDRLGSGVSG